MLKQALRTIVKSYHAQAKINDVNHNVDEMVKIRAILEKAPLNHIGIIPDGNRRWAKQKGLSKKQGHAVGFNNALYISNVILDIGSIHSTTIFACSTDNFFKRDKQEIKDVFVALNDYMLRFLQYSAPKYGVMMNHLGNKNILPSDVVDVINYVEDKSKHFDNHLLNMCIGYDGVEEICSAFNKMQHDEIGSINTDILMQYLYKHNVKYTDIDFVIRPGNVQRLSKFMSVQAGNAEYYFPDGYWPDFDENELFKAIKSYCAVERRCGK